MPEAELLYPQPVKPGNLQSQPLGLSPFAPANISPVAPQDIYLGARRHLLSHGRRVIISHTSAVTPEWHGSSQMFFFAGISCPAARTVELTWETAFVRAAEVRITCTPPKVESAVDLWLASTRRQISELERLRGGWDDASALPFGQATLRSALAVLNTISAFLQVSGIRTFPTLVPLSDGSIRFEWVNGDRELFLTILEGNVEAQRWQPLGSVQSLSYVQMRPEQLPAELEWLAG